VKSSQRQRKSYFELQQPFDLFEDFHKSTGPAAYRQPPKARSNSTRLWAVLGFILLLGLGGWFLTSMQNNDGRHPYVFLELRAVSPKGNPLAGVQVKINRKEMGLTDSFGEWRRYLRVKPGIKLNVEMMKKYRGYTFKARKRLTVPRRGVKEAETEIKTTLALELETKRSPDSESTTRSSKVAATTSSSSQETSALRVPSSYLSQNHLAAVDIRHVKFKPHYNTLMERHQAKVLRNRVLPELIAQVEERNVRMDRQASWKFLLSYIPVRGRVGMVRGELFWRDHRGRPQKNSFLTGFAKTVEQTAENLLELAKDHVNKHYGATYHRGAWYLAAPDKDRLWRLSTKSRLKDPTGEVFGLKRVKLTDSHEIWRVEGEGAEPCGTIPRTQECPLSSASLKDRPPYPRWTLKQMTLQGDLPADAEIYVAGYRAYPLRGPYWAYWGAPEHKQKVTVVRNYRIFHRTALEPSPRGPVVLQLPGTSVSRTSRSASSRM
jgi:hypothetical protein